MKFLRLHSTINETLKYSFATFMIESETYSHHLWIIFIRFDGNLTVFDGFKTLWVTPYILGYDVDVSYQ